MQKPICVKFGRSLLPVPGLRIREKIGSATDLQAAVSLIALSTGLFMGTSAFAADFTASTQAELITAINNANSTGQSSTITLRADITLSNTVPLPAVNIPITIITGEFTLRGMPGTGVSGNGGSINIPGGPITIVGTLKGGNADITDSNGTGGAGIQKNNGSLENRGVIKGGTGGGTSRSGTAGNAGRGGVGAALTNTTVVNGVDGVISGGDGGNFDAQNMPGGAVGGRTGDGGVGLTLTGGSLDNRGLIEGGSGGMFGHLPAAGADNYFGGAGGTGAILNGGDHRNSGIIRGGRGGEGVNTGATGHGAPGMGAQLTNGTLYNTGIISGADGRNGGGTLGAGNHGATGINLVNSRLENFGTINGGNAGPLMGPQALGGIAVIGTGGTTVVNGGVINAGRNGNDSFGTALQFTGGGNTLELHSGYEIYGRVSGSNSLTSPDIFVLGGVGNGTFDVSKFNPGGQIQGFGIYEKRGPSTWTLTGTTTALTPWTIYDGVLEVSEDGNLGATAGVLTFSGGTLRNTDDFTSARNFVVNPAGGTIQTNADLTLTGVISGTGPLVKNGNAALVLTGNSSGFAGSTLVDAGTLVVNGSLCGPMTVGKTARLQGTGTVCDTTNMGVVAPGNGIGTFTIDGNYVGNGGMLEIETVLGGDGSVADLLVITGDTSGETDVRVINLGGVGALTTEGIKVIDVGGASNGLFSLIGSYTLQGSEVIVAGAYAYGLYKGGMSTPDDGDWYLRSLYQAGVPIYETYASTLQSFNKLGTMQQRLGNRFWATLPEPVEKGMPSQYGLIEGNGLWGRLEASDSRFLPKISTSGVEYDVTNWRAEAGADLLLAEESFGSLIGSLIGHYGTVSSDVYSIHGEGSIESAGGGVGGALTWYGTNDFYVDGQGHATWYKSDLYSSTAGMDLAKDRDAFGYNLGLEVGKRFWFGRRWSATPQAQFAYSRINFENFVDPFGAAVTFEKSESLLGRLGITVDRQTEWMNGSGTTNRSHLYGIANLHYDFAGSWHVDVASTVLEHQNQPLWGGLGIGGTLNVADDKYSVYGEAQARTSFENFGDSRLLSGTLGLRVAW